MDEDTITPTDSTDDFQSLVDANNATEEGAFASDVPQESFFARHKKTLLVVGVALLGIVGYIIYRRNASTTVTSPSTSTSPSTTSSQSAIPPPVPPVASEGGLAGGVGTTAPATVNLSPIEQLLAAQEAQNQAFQNTMLAAQQNSQSLATQLEQSNAQNASSINANLQAILAQNSQTEQSIVSGQNAGFAALLQSLASKTTSVSTATSSAVKNASTSNAITTGTVYTPPSNTSNPYGSVAQSEGTVSHVAVVNTGKASSYNGLTEKQVLQSANVSAGTMTQVSQTPQNQNPQTGSTYTPASSTSNPYGSTNELFKYNPSFNPFTLPAFSGGSYPSTTSVGSGGSIKIAP